MARLEIVAIGMRGHRPRAVEDARQLGADRGERGGVEHVGNHEISLILVELHVGGREHGSESPCSKG
jgi:hypothetical protein